MTKTKRFVACFLTIAMIFACSITSYAQSNNTADINTDTEIFVPDTEEVAVIHICSTAVGGSFLIGHTWVYIENSSDTEILVGSYSLSPGEGVSVGTAGIAGGKGPRMYYNLESDVFINSGYISTKDYVSKEELDKINEKLSHLDRWDPFFNCTYSATQIWNIASNNKFTSFIFPFVICIQIQINGTDTAFEMTESDSDDLRVYGESKAQSTKTETTHINESEPEDCTTTHI